MQGTLVCFGDSFTKGKVFDLKDKDFRITAKNFPNLLARGLPLIKVINAGVNDNTTFDALNRIEKDVLAKNPNYVLILFGGNDVRIDWFKLIISGFRDPKSKVSLKDYRVNLIKMVSILRKNTILPILVTLPPIDTSQFLKRLSIAFGTRIISIIKKHSGGKRIKCTYAKYNDAIKTIAKNTKVPIIDLRREMLKFKNWQDFLSQDGAHPSTKGHAFMAKIIADSLNKLIFK
ncbi:MAG: GDSL-type esterase/lipase family protein [Candidatus Omnitrophota bacterium]